MNLREIEQAAQRLRGVVHTTPIDYSGTFSRLAKADIHLKCENMQKTGSFKVRGAYNKIAKLAQAGDVPLLVAASAGNHAQGVAFAAGAVGAQAVIVMPAGTPIAKVEATAGYGAEVVLHGDCYDDAYARAREICDERHGVFVHPFDDDDVIAGQGTIALELLEQLPDLQAVLIPAGGGGLLAGMATCLKSLNPRVRVIGVQACGADAIVRSKHAGELVATDSCHTIADGIAVKRPGLRTTALICEHVDEMVTVTDDEIAQAILLLMERTKLVVEPAGAVTVAAAMSGKGGIAGLRAVCVLSGGNIDVGFIHKIVERGLVSRGRKLRLCTVMSDVPGSLYNFALILAQTGANILMIQHDRERGGLSLGEALLRVECEVSGPSHGQAVVQALEQAGYRVTREE